MKRPSEAESTSEELRDRIIGLGERSIRKSYFPELQQKLRELKEEIAVRERREQQLQSNFRNHALINELLKLSLEDIPLDTLFEQSLKKILALDWLVSDTAAAIFLLDDSGALALHASRGYLSCGVEPCAEVRPGECLCGLAAATGEVQFASEIDERHTIRRPGMKEHGHYCVPIRLAEKSVGVLSLSLPNGHLHDRSEEGFFVSFATTLAGIIKRHRLDREKKQVERLLLQAQKIEALGTLSGGIAHDFNNLLAPMLGFAELALKDIEPGSRAESRIREVIKAATQAKNLVRQILTLSHQGFADKELSPLRLDRVIEEVLPLVRAAIPTTIDIRMKICHDDCRVLADATQIHQVILNLCTNAYHAIREADGVIEITLRHTHLGENDLKIHSLQLAEGDYLILEINDNGCGMDRETLDRIFDPYFTTKKQGEGTGLGLAVANGIVKGFGGMISVYSEPERGTSFQIYLPKVDAKVVELEPQDSELPVGTEQILVVDDQLQVGQVTCEILETLGYRSTLFSACHSAIQAFRDDPRRYDLVITDMTMPKMTGLELASRLRKCRPEIPIILCTGFSELVSEQKARASGFQRFLLKPVMMRELAFAVREVLDAKDDMPA